MNIFTLKEDQSPQFIGGEEGSVAFVYQILPASCKIYTSIIKYDST